MSNEYIQPSNKNIFIDLIPPKESVWPLHALLKKTLYEQLHSTKNVIHFVVMIKIPFVCKFN